MSALQRLQERFNQNARHKEQGGDNTTDTADIRSQEYTRMTSEASEHTGHSTDITQHRTWIKRIQENGNRAEDWLEITNAVRNSMVGSSWKTYISHLCMLYAKAINAIDLDSHKNNAAYAQLLINFADIKSNISVEEARSLLHFARKNIKKIAMVHVAAAQLEVSKGSRAKAEQILEKALQVKAVPEDLVKTAIQNLEAGKMTLCPNKETSVLSSNKENIEHPPVTNTVSATNLAAENFPSHDMEVMPLPNPDRSLCPGVVAKPETKVSSGVDYLLSGKLQFSGNAYEKSRHNANKEQLSGSIKYDSFQEKSGSMSFSKIQLVEEAKGSSVDIAAKKTGDVSMVTSSSQPKSQSAASKPPSGSSNSMYNMSFNDSTVTFRKSKVHRNSESDDAHTDPVQLVKEKDVPERTLTTYNSTPDCKGPGFLKHFSNRKPGVLGKPRRVKRSSLPQLSEGTSAGDDDSYQLSSLTERDGSGLLVHEQCDPRGAPMSRNTTKANGMVESKDVVVLSRRTMEESEMANEGGGDGMSCDEDSLKEDKDSDIITTTPDSLPPTSKANGSIHLLDKSADRTSSTVQSTVVHGRDPGLFHIRSYENSKTPCQVNSSSDQQKITDGGLSGIVPFSSSVPPPCNRNNPADAMVHSSSDASGSSCSGPPPAANVVPTFFQPSRNRPKETLTVCGKVYTLLNVLGRGGSSEVYSTLDSSCQLRAIKCVNLSGADESTFKSYMNEIKLLKRLQHSDRIIKLFDYEYVSSEEVLYIVLERGDTDLATLFRQHAKNGAFDALTQKFYWKEMLRAVQVLHNEGIVHSDLKPANFLFVAGKLKLIDFGIAKALHHEKTSITCEQAVGTLNYLSPEAIMETCTGTGVDAKIKIGVKSDVWSLGCILYNMVYGRSPFHHISNSIAKLHAITNPKVEISFPETADPVLRQVIMKCLQRDPKLRPTVKELLSYNY